MGFVETGNSGGGVTGESEGDLEGPYVVGVAVGFLGGDADDMGITKHITIKISMYEIFIIYKLLKAQIC